MRDAEAHLSLLLDRYPALTACQDGIRAAFEALRACFAAGGKVLFCGNGGSCADCDHIVGELMKGFKLPRPLGRETIAALERVAGPAGVAMAAKLQRGLPAINLCAHQSLITAVANDNSPDMIFAQQVMAYGRPGDVLVGISPIGKAVNVINAMIVARALGMTVVGLAGSPGGDLPGHCDVAVVVPECEVFAAQELHLPLYHAWCLMLETYFFGTDAT